MLYIVGGAPRSGKTLLSKRILTERNVPYFPLDALIGTLAESMPEFGVSHSETFITKSERLWKLSKHLLNFFVINKGEYLIEGDSILPSQVGEFMNENKDVRACFMGYPDLKPQEKLILLRKFGEGKDDWTNQHSDEVLLPILERSIEYSKYLKSECTKHGIPFFDVSENFEKVRREAFDYLTARS